MSKRDSALVAGLGALARGGVDFIVVGVGGINFYAADEASAIATLDIDILLRPDVATLRAAFAALQKVGFTFEAGGEPFVDFEDDVVLHNIVRSGASLTARHARGAQLDLMLSITGLHYDALAADPVTFTVARAPVRVGRLEKLLRSKELAGRPKDVEFLRLFAARFRNDLPRRSVDATVPKVRGPRRTAAPPKNPRPKKR
ncbi:MAG: hypothetical protein HY271_11760 [Deltaproteobacteria bacterium]|nr:hypothetical protein [Deltaproteobacteria bacterium]